MTPLHHIVEIAAIGIDILMPIAALGFLFLLITQRRSV